MSAAPEAISVAKHLLIEGLDRLAEWGPVIPAERVDAAAGETGMTPEGFRALLRDVNDGRYGDLDEPGSGVDA